MTEADLMRAIQLAATQRGHRLWRNNSAQGWAGKFLKRYANGSVLIGDAYPLHAGLSVGSSDLIGLTSMGRFLSIEVKSPRGRLTEEQQAWIAMVRQFGGLAGEARSIEDLDEILAYTHNP